MLRIYQYEHPGRTVVEGLVFGSSARYEATRTLSSGLYSCENVDHMKLLRYHDYTGKRKEPPPVPPEMMPLSMPVTFHLPSSSTANWTDICVAPNGDLVMAGNERIRARFTVGNYNSVARTLDDNDNVDDIVPLAIIEENLNNEFDVMNINEHFDGSVDTLNYESENEEEVDASNYQL